MFDDTVPERTAVEQIGANHIAGLIALNQWLYSPDEPDLECFRPTFRAAPSIAVRSECELFGVSSPRFAFRTYLSKGSFVNSRRLEVLALTANEEWSRRVAAGSKCVPNHKPYEVVSGTNLRRSAADLIREGSCLADAIIAPPDRYTQNGYRILTIESGRIYGEARSSHGEIKGTPYLKSMKLGGGLCAQAACFMASMLLQDFVRGIHGIAEITSIATDSNRAELNLGGMTAARIVSYLRDSQTGLNASDQTVHQLPLIPPMSVDAAHFTWVSSAIRSYVLSGMPVIVPIDVGRMAGFGGIETNDSIYYRNLLRSVISYSQPVYHAVIVVGCHESSASEFLINDPATRPLLQASGKQLFDARPYQRNSDDAVKPQQRVMRVISATPREVRLPLLDDYAESRAGGKPVATVSWGLFRLVDELLTRPCGPQTSEALARYGPIDVWANEFRLINLAELTLQKRFGELAIADLPPYAVAQLKELISQLRLVADWVWIQFAHDDMDGTKGPVWVWRATQGPLVVTPTFNRADLEKRYLICVLYPISGTVQVVDGSTKDQVEALDQIDGTCHLTHAHQSWSTCYPRPALISSFRTRGYSDSARHWPVSPNGQSPGCELYSLMQTEVDRILDQRIEAPYTTAFGFMADTAGNEEKIRDIAKDIASTKRFCPNSVPIVGLATFLPAIGSPPRSKNADRFCSAIQFLARLALYLRELGHPSSVIELVGGSKIDGIWPALRTHPKPMSLDNEAACQFIANRVDDEAARTRIVENLRAALSRLSHCERMVKFAIELEPGPIFAVRDWNTLVEICIALDADAELSQHVGVNLDIAHWRLAAGEERSSRITPALVRSSKVVMRRIAHAHIAGHHDCAHLGDLALDVLNDPAQDFAPWLTLLKELPANGNKLYSGCVSIELEAAKDSRSASDSLTTLVNLLLECT